MVTIDYLIAIFHIFHQDSSRALREHKPMSAEQEMAFRGVRTKLKRDLEEVGLAAHIEWGE